MIPLPPRSPRTDTLLPYTTRFRSIDAWGSQSILAPYASTAADRAAYMHPPERISLRNLQAGIEVSWATPHDAGTRRYVIYRSTLKRDDLEKVATVSPATHRSEERRVGKECVSTCRSRWAPYH